MLPLATSMPGARGRKHKGRQLNKQYLTSQCRLSISLPCHDLRDGMSDRHARLFDLFLCQPRRDAHLERWLNDDIRVLRPKTADQRRRLQSRDKDPVRK
jgi:hypothetical protein